MHDEIVLPPGTRSEREGDRIYFRFPESVCFGCSSSNPAGLRLRFFREGDRIVCEHEVSPQHEGATGIIHGGIQATLFDETMCAAMVFLEGRYVVTGELTVRYEKPCPSQVPIRVSAWVEELREKYAIVRGEMYDPAGALAAKAHGRFFYDPSRNPALS